MTTFFRLSTFLPYRLAVIAERVSARLAANYGASHNLTVAEWRVLVHLQHCGVVSVRDVQVFTNLVKSRVSRAVSRLETAGFVEKQTAAADARLVEISLTKAGQDALAVILEDAMQTETQLLEHVSEEDLATFLRVIDTMHKTLDQDPKANPMPKPVAAGTEEEE